MVTIKRPAPSGFLTVKQAASELGVTRQRVHQLMAQGAIPVYAGLITSADVRRLAARRTVPGPVPAKGRK